MVDKDLAVGAVGGIPPVNPSGVPSGAIYAGNLPTGSPISKKPCYLVVIEGKSKAISRFIAVEQPSYHDSFVQVKGLYSSLSEEEIVKKFSEVVQSTPKDQQMEIAFPDCRILYIRSLVFNAVKPIMVNK